MFLPLVYVSGWDTLLWSGISVQSNPEIAQQRCYLQL